MNPLILLLLGGGVVAVGVATSGSGASRLASPNEGGAPSNASLNAAMAARGYAWNEDGTEKFADPRFAWCYGWNDTGRMDYSAGTREFSAVVVPGPFAVWGQAGELVYGATKTGGMLVTNGTGLDYLNEEPARARGRAAVLRAYVERFGDAVELAGNERTMVSGLAKASGLAMRVAAYDVAGKLRDGRAALAASLGVEAGKLERAAGEFSAAVLRAESEVNEGTRRYLRIDVMSLFRDLNKLAGGALAGALAAVARSLAATFAGVTGAATGAAAELSARFASLQAGAASVAAALPVLKQAVDIALQLEKDGQAAADAACLAWNQINVFGPLGEAAALGMPVPWHVLDIWHVSCETVPRGTIEAFTDDLGASNDARLALRQARDLGFADAALDARRFWGLLTLYAGDPLVERTLRAMGQQRGLWASDEAVAVVGVVVATAYQLADVWGFVELLWGYAIGWQQYRALAKPYGKNKSAPELGAYFPLRDEAQRAECAAAPYNAWSLNLAAVASCAFVLAEEVSARGMLQTASVEPLLLLAR